VWVKRRSGCALNEDELKAFCREKIAYFKIPHHVFFVESFPMTVTGKIQKFLMREESIKLLGL
jgi:fatty-acyl-CoA synthase